MAKTIEYEGQELTNKSGVYKITNIVTNKIYVGSSKSLRSRMHGHFTALRAGTHSSSHLQRSYNKYGRGAFLFDVITYCETSELIKTEQYYIDTLCPEYNSRKIADSNSGLVRSEETKLKISLAQKNKEFSEEYRQKLSDSQKGKTQSKDRVAKRVASRKKTYDALTPEQKAEHYKSRKGRAVSEETKAKLSVAGKKAWSVPEIRRKLTLAIKSGWSKGRSE